MRIYKIAVWGDNDRLHAEALAAAVKAVEEVNKSRVDRAWFERVDIETAHESAHADRSGQE